MARVVIVGAGSVEFTRNVVADLCSYEELHGGFTIALHDIDEQRLSYSTRAAESIVRRTGAGYVVEAHTDRRAALEGAGYAAAAYANLTGVRTLELIVTGAGDGIGNDHADWAGARVACG